MCEKRSPTFNIIANTNRISIWFDNDFAHSFSFTQLCSSISEWYEVVCQKKHLNHRFELKI